MNFSQPLNASVSESPFQSYKSWKRICLLLINILICSSVSGPKALKNMSAFCPSQQQWKITEYFEIVLKIYYLHATAIRGTQLFPLICNTFSSCSSFRYQPGVVMCSSSIWFLFMSSSYFSWGVSHTRFMLVGTFCFNFFSLCSFWVKYFNNVKIQSCRLRYMYNQSPMKNNSCWVILCNVTRNTTWQQHVNR